jgi:hypothetical protein
VEEKMNEKQTQFDWAFGLQWLVVVAVGIAAAGMLAFTFVWSVGEAVENVLGETVAILITGGLFGAIFALGAGLGSGLLMRRQGISARRWILATVVAGAIGMAIGFTLAFTFLDVDTMPEALAGVMMGLSLGLPIGIGQSLARFPHRKTGGFSIFLYAGNHGSNSIRIRNRKIRSLGNRRRHLQADRDGKGYR